MSARTMATWAAVAALLALAFGPDAIGAQRPPSPQHKEAARILAATGIKGGLIVHVGCGDGKLTAALRANDSTLVHGLDRDAKNVAKARAHIRSLGLYGKASADRWSGRRLPYADNLVNLLVAEDLGALPMGEVLRVLCPKGVACIRRGGKWARTVKPWPDAIDEWTHFLHDASGNAVAKDRRVGPPRRIQWLAGPKRSRNHDALASLSAMVSSGGRLFYIFDEGPTSLVHHPPKWRLIARDAFNGTLLWTRDIPTWITHLYYFRCGPVWLARRLVAAGGRVHVTLGLDAPATALDAVTGKTLLTYEGSERTEEIIVHDDVLLAAIGDPSLMNREARKVWAYWEHRVAEKPTVAKSIAAYRASTGEPLWRKADRNLGYLVPLSLSASGGRAFYMDNERLYCVELTTGKELWRAAFPTEGLFKRNYAPTLVVHDDVVVVLCARKLAALSVQDGRTLWETKGYLGFASPGDLFVIGGLVWAIPATRAVRMPKGALPLGGGKEFLGLDLHTGAVKRTFAKSKLWAQVHHHRCYRNKATVRYIISGMRGMEFIDLHGSAHSQNHWIRGECQYGILPCNGLTYAPPDPCACYSLVKLDGFYALAAERGPRQPAPVPAGQRLDRGPAYRAIANRKWQIGNDDWPTFRHDIARSGSTKTRVPAELAQVWATDVDEALTASVVAGGRLYVASKATHTLHCIDAANGRPLWRFTAGGPVDSPPTLFGGLAIFGSRDGRVCALRARDGALAWCFRAAPADRRVVANQQLESVWPVHGSVLVLGGVAYFAAGRSTHLDGGIWLFGLDAGSGEKLHETCLNRSAGAAANVLPDVLVSDGTHINMRHRIFDAKLVPQAGRKITTLMSTTGLLEDAWGHRHNWTLGYRSRLDKGTGLHTTGFNSANPFGKLLVFDQRCAYGIQHPYTFLKFRPPRRPPGHLHQKYALYKPEEFPLGVGLFAQENTAIRAAAAPGKPKGRAKKKGGRRGGFLSADSHKWDVRVPLQARAMVLTREALFVAGRLDSRRILEGEAGGPAGGGPGQAVLWAISPADGKKLAERKLPAPPVFDGMIAANGRLYMATSRGRVLCMGAR